MIINNLTEKKALEGFGSGIDCSMAVLSEIGPQLGLDKETCLKVAGAFGGGMWRGDTCGCVSGALMALGLKYTNKEELLAKKTEFEEKFSAKYGSCICRDMLGYDIGKGEIQKIMDEGCFEKICCKAAKDACDIVAEIINA